MTRPVSEETIRARFAAHTRSVDGGHLEWTGPAEMSWRGRHWRPAALALHLRTGRMPEGRVSADCGHHRCVLPEHVEDAAGRTHIRGQVRALRSIPDIAPACRRGHDQNAHGSLRSDGTAYCTACAGVRRATRGAA